MSQLDEYIQATNRQLELEAEQLERQAEQLAEQGLDDEAEEASRRAVDKRRSILLNQADAQLARRILKRPILEPLLSVSLFPTRKS